MIIISQDKSKIVNFNNIANIRIINCSKDEHLISAGFITEIDGDYKDLGYYKTEERAKEVLQEIIRALIEAKKLKSANSTFGFDLIPPNTVYEMPER